MLSGLISFKLLKQGKKERIIIKLWQFMRIRWKLEMTSPFTFAVILFSWCFLWSSNGGLISSGQQCKRDHDMKIIKTNRICCLIMWAKETHPIFLFNTSTTASVLHANSERKMTEMQFLFLVAHTSERKTISKTQFIYVGRLF